MQTLLLSLQRTEHIYDGFNRLSSQSYTVGDTTYAESYTYSDGAEGDGTLTQMTLGEEDKITYDYDELKRLTTKTVKHGSATVLENNYTYANVTLDDGLYTTPLVEEHTVERSNTTLTGAEYVYDALGNIIQIKESGDSDDLLAQYIYNSQGQMTHELLYNDAGTLTHYYLYSYDTAGNILTEHYNGVLKKTYTYNDAQWVDKLTAFNGVNFSYDAVGNPKSYTNGTALYSLEWEHGRQLASAGVDSNDTLTLDFTYGIDGIRTAKEVSSRAGLQSYHSYITQNGKVVRETIGNGMYVTVMDFFYDESGKPFAMNYSVDGGNSFATYYYVLNLQGDVVKLINSSCSEVAAYTYNAWGEILTATGMMAEINPLRYRGYYYDTETGWYYLQSRYYDPVMHRFINADSFASTGQSFIGTNMFAYCGNNPAGRLDPQGNAWYDIFVDFWEDVKDVAEDVYDYVTNTDEQVVLDADYLAFYKGVPVLKLPIGKDAFSFGIMFIGDDVDERSDSIETVQHEYGHCVQFACMGPVKYTAYVAAPSITGYITDTEDYYSQPWEYTADILGGVDRGNYTSSAPVYAKIFWAIAMLS